MEKLRVKISFPIIVHVDNVGSICLPENIDATSPTRHVDAQNIVVWEFVLESYINNSIYQI